MEQLEYLIEERNAAAKNAEEELIIFIQNRPQIKNKKKFNTTNVVGSIDYIKRMNINNNKYPKLLRWKQLHNDLQSFIDNLPNNNTNNNYYNKISIIAEGRDYGFDVNDIENKLPQLSFLNRLPKLPKIFTRKNTQKNSSVRSATQVTPVTPVTPVSKPWYQFWRAGRKTQRKTKNHKRRGSRGGNPYIGNPYIGMKLQNIEAAKSQAQQALNDAIFRYKTVAELYKQNPQSYQKMAFKHSDAVKDARNALNDIKNAEEKALKQQIQAPRTSSWLPSWGRGGRKTHHKKRHTCKGSRKIHRK